MDKLVTVTKADDVTDDYKKEAKTWTVWNSGKRKRFPYNYTAEERVLVLAGAATLTPSDGSDPIEIAAGNAVTFHVGFRCKWNITQRMKKYYAVFAAPDAEEAPAISCDECGKDCVAESYFVAKGELDICPACYGKDKKKFENAEHQKEGEKWVEPAPASDSGPKKKKSKK